MIWTKDFWKGAAERAIKTFAQTIVATIGVLAVGDLAGFEAINWITVASVSGVAAVLSIFTSIANADNVVIGSVAVAEAKEASKEVAEQVVDNAVEDVANENVG